MTGPPAPSAFPGTPARRLTVLLSARDRSGHGSLMVELLKRARQADLAGATAFEADAGFGSSGRLHRPRLLSKDNPVAVVIVDQPERIDRFVAETGDLLSGVLVVVEDVEVVDLSGGS